MSTKSKLLELTGNLDPAVPVSRDTPAPAAPTNQNAQREFPPVGGRTSARTGPGQMLQLRGHMLAAEGELEQLRVRLKEHEGALPTRLLDPKAVHDSKWANRHPDSFSGSEFAGLKQDIEAAGGNVQPIKVRPIPGKPGEYELIFGHRRRRACLELGLQVLAMVDDGVVSDSDLFKEMDRENRERADLSPYEQGLMYRRALDENLFPSNRRLAEALGVSHTWVSNVLAVADLPPAVLECFRSPLEVQYRHAKLVLGALEADRRGVLRRADKVRSSEKRPPAATVVAALIGRADPAEKTHNSVTVDGKRVGTWSRSGKGAVAIQLALEDLPDEQIETAMRAFVAALAPR